MPRTFGTDMMQKIADGRVTPVPTAEVLRQRDLISTEIEELLEVGARVRPLLVDGKRIGWVRGVHMAERKALRRYFPDAVDLAEYIVRYGTTLDPQYIAGFSTVELRSVLRVITEMSTSDLRLYPFLTPFSTTTLSEQLWFAKGQELTRAFNRVIQMPDGKCLTLLSPPDQARLWAWLCSYREQSKQQNSATANACLVVRVWAGKSADGLANEVKNVAKALQPDNLDPWVESIKYVAPINFDDGWAHSEDSSPEGMMREIRGMLSNDRHEQVFQEFERIQRVKAEVNRKQSEDRIAAFGGGPGVVHERREVLTAEEAKKRAAAMKESRARRRAMASELGQNPIEKLSRYQ